MNHPLVIYIPNGPDDLLALLPLLIWIVLIGFRGLFWRSSVRDLKLCPDPAVWPSVQILIPARNEAETIGPVVASLLAQDYPGPFLLLLIDDESSDGTAQVARAAAEDQAQRLRILLGRPRSGWTGKLAALHNGYEAVEAQSQPEFYWLSDADIAYAPDTLRSLVSRAQRDDLQLVSLMAKLRCESFAEKLLIPAFIYFFEMLYPFAWVNQRKRKVAGAAGGCMLVRAAALRQINGFQSIRHALIDDCSLAGELKKLGGIDLRLSERAQSLRPYPHFSDIGAMVRRSAFAQLNYSSWQLLGTLVSMLLVYVFPVFLALFSEGWPAFFGLLTWVLMTLSYRPTLRFYRLGQWWAPLLPLIASIYLIFTIQSAVQYWFGRGGQWKGRIQAPGGSAP